jgi:hypothetical protein
MELMALEEHQQLLALTRVMALLSWELAVMVVSATGIRRHEYFVSHSFVLINITAAPGKGPQGIDLLDNLSFCFSASGTTINQPPVAIGIPPGNKIELECDGSIKDKVLTFSGPEGDQLVKLSTSTAGDASKLSVGIDDNKQTASSTINWTPSAAVTTKLSITATDNGLKGSGQNEKSTTVDIDLVYPGPCNPANEPCEDAQKFMAQVCALCPTVPK